MCGNSVPETNANSPLFFCFFFLFFFPSFFLKHQTFIRIFTLLHLLTFSFPLGARREVIPTQQTQSEPLIT